jgi:hypothetical protein
LRGRVRQRPYAQARERFVLLSHALRERGAEPRDRHD